MNITTKRNNSHHLRSRQPVRNQFQDVEIRLVCIIEAWRINETQVKTWEGELYDRDIVGKGLQAMSNYASYPGS